ncbi:ornithine carbamoyltransferase [Streptomyces sp. 5-8]|uniref:Ornithine carbamoyltransferase n=1 Tax=Streptomyces musisoli TaxID=2802280 RepID=A0ABS1PBQ6_9ACTN|nr:MULTISPECIES: ornithine carbamoyltransferase [Streptomyces]MBL1109805.1 ornithine carbamoyltransferase [Streptomyces musisoli]MBY8845920.1 ornithine carbamoyltransferase [Streptomyces sp. SP2-10]
MRNLISLADLTPAELDRIVRRAVFFGREGVDRRSLDGKQVGVYFRKSSTRTRTSFWSAATRLGADVVTYGPDELQLSTGETVEDTSRVLGQYLDALVVRTNGDVEEIRRLGSSPDLAVVNALSLDEHPTQAIADLATLTERFGSLDGLHLLAVGEGNSSGAALALAAALSPGLRLTLLCPSGYEVPKDKLDLADELAGGKAPVTQVTSLDEVDGPVDAVYTSRWQTMGVPKADPDWLKDFEGFRIDDAFLDRFGGPDVVFLHDLPAVRGQEVTDEVLDGPRSVAWRQAYHKMTAAMAVLEWCVVSSGN